jgi:hypothetical protein
VVAVVVLQVKTPRMVVTAVMVSRPLQMAVVVAVAVWAVMVPLPQLLQARMVVSLTPVQLVAQAIRALQAVRVLTVAAVAVVRGATSTTILHISAVLAVPVLRTRLLQVAQQDPVAVAAVAVVATIRVRLLVRVLLQETTVVAVVAVVVLLLLVTVVMVPKALLSSLTRTSPTKP